MTEYPRTLETQEEADVASEYATDGTRFKVGDIALHDPDAGVFRSPRPPPLTQGPPAPCPARQGM